jgi:hypothetical protein
VSTNDERRIDTLIGEVFGEGEEAELIRSAIRESLSGTRRVRQQQKCPSCKATFRGEFTVKDSSSSQKTIEWLADRLAGRPGLQKDEGDGLLIFVNTTKLVDADGVDTIEWLSERGLLSRPIGEVEAQWTRGHSSPPDQAEKLRALGDAGELA